MATRVTYLLDSSNMGGAEMSVVQLLAHPQLDATVVAASPVSPHFHRRVQASGARLVEVGPVGARWQRIPALIAAVRRSSPDVVHVNLVDPRSNRVLLAAAIATGAPTVATCHMTGMAGRGPSRWVLQRLFRRMDAVLAVSAEIADLLQGLGVDRVHHLRNGVAIANHSCDRPMAPGRVGIGAVARLTPQKGIDLLIDAVAVLRTRGHDVELDIAGEGRDAASLSARADGLPVRFHGHVDDVAPFLAHIDVFCLPSRAEGLPLALLEAMAAGLPCVVTDVGDIRASVSDAAVVVPPGHTDRLVAALGRLVGDPAARQRLGARARAAAIERFDVRNTIASVMEVYSAVAPHTPHEGPPLHPVTPHST